MISLKLWRALSKPPRRHPLFQYVLTGAKREEPQVTSGFVVWVMVLAAIIFIGTVLFQPMMWFILALFLSLNSIYATRWVLRISRTILAEKASRRYDLLASLPVGLLGTSWALSTGAIHKRSSFRWIPYLILMTVIIAFLALCGLSTITITMIEQLSDNETAFVENLAFARIGFQIIPFVILFYIDHVYSILTAVVFGQIATIDAQHESEGQVRALLGFLTIQILTYIIGFVVAAFGLPAIFTTFGFTQVSHLIMIGIIGIVFFVFLREWIVFSLWRYLARTLEADDQEIALVLKPFYEAEAILKESEKARERHLDTAT